jgi:molybdate transport system ATP-binding protein
VVLDDRVLTDVGPEGAGVLVAPHDRRTALLGQDALLFPHLDALENVAFGPRSLGTDRRAARTAAQRWLDEVGVGELSDRRPGQLSGGQAQRVAVARALAAEPRLLLLDEPMAALDVAVQPALRQVLRRVLEDRTSIIVTHDPLDALLLADRVAVLEAGRVVEHGPSAEVLSRPRSAFAARLAGLNLVRGTWREGAVHSDALVVHGLVEGSSPADGEPAVAAFRPQAVAVYREEPHGSPRNAFPATVTEVEPHTDLIRVRSGDLAADVTVQATAELELTVGSRVTFVVKATEVSLYGL